MTHPDTLRADTYARELNEAEEQLRALHRMLEFLVETVREQAERIRVMEAQRNAVLGLCTWAEMHDHGAPRNMHSEEIRFALSESAARGQA